MICRPLTSGSDALGAVSFGGGITIPPIQAHKATGLARHALDARDVAHRGTRWDSFSQRLPPLQRTGTCIQASAALLAVPLAWTGSATPLRAGRERGRPPVRPAQLTPLPAGRLSACLSPPRRRWRPRLPSGKWATRRAASVSPAQCASLQWHCRPAPQQQAR